MLRTTKWFARELERRDRQHAAELAAEREAFRNERERLLETVCILAGRPIYPADTRELTDDDEGDDELVDVRNQPDEPPVTDGEHLLYR